MEKTFFLIMAEQYKDMIYRIAINYYRNPYDAEDTLQDVLIKLYHTDKIFENTEHVRNWLIRVTINECKNTLRMPWRIREVDFNQLTGSVEFASPAESDLLQYVFQLPLKYRTVLYLFYYEDLTVKEIAQHLQLKDSAVTTRLCRARLRLKKLMEV